MEPHYRYSTPVCANGRRTVHRITPACRLRFSSHLPTVSEPISHPSSARAGRGLVLAGYLAALAASAAAILFLRVPLAGFSAADEPAHFLNAYFIHRWLTGEFGWHPLAAAIDFYVHYPKLAIGHWPPLHYALVAATFQLLPATPPVAMVVNLVLSTLPALFVGVVVGRLAGPGAAIAACIWYGVLPIVVQSQMFFMTDQAVTAWACAAAAAWVVHAARPGLASALAFAALAAAAVLTKGSGWLVGLLPALHIALTGRWHLLRDGRLYFAAAAAAIVLAPWYFVTARLTAGSWAFEPGLDYAFASVAANAAAIAGSLGPVGVLLAGYELVQAARGRRLDARRWDWCAVCAALVIATLALHAVVPASLEMRFMAPALPAGVTLAALGLSRLLAGQPAGRRAIALALAGVVLLWPAARFLTTTAPKVDLRAADAASAIADASRPGGLGTAAAPSIWLIDGTAGAEGAMIAEVAVRDAARSIYLTRSSQLLSQSDWNGRHYRLLVRDETDTLTRLRALGVRGVAVIFRDGAAAAPHTGLLLRALGAPGSGYRLAHRFEHRHRAAGHTELWIATQPVHADLAGLRAATFPAKFKSLGASDDVPR